MFNSSKMKIVDRKISELIPAEYNPRKISDDGKKELRESFESLGTLRPALINKYPGRENVIISGHQSIEIAIEMGLTEYPCFEVSFDPEKEKEANIRMNTHNGEWDVKLLEMEFNPDELASWGAHDVANLLAGSDETDGGGGDIQFSTELDEESNFVVLKFDKDIDFLNIESILHLPRTHSKRQNGKPWSKGIGRVVDGVEAIKKFRASK